MPDGISLADLAGNNIWTRHQYYPASAIQTLTTATATVTCNRRTVAVTASSELTLTSVPTIPAGSDGQVCVIVNV